MVDLVVVVKSAGIRKSACYVRAKSINGTHATVIFLRNIVNSLLLSGHLSFPPRGYLTCAVTSVLYIPYVYMRVSYKERTTGIEIKENSKQELFIIYCVPYSSTNHDPAKKSMYTDVYISVGMYILTYVYL